MMKCSKKPVIWLAGDSTLQSYSEEKRPQWGWGEKVAELLEETDAGESSQIRMFHREDSPFEQQKRYEGSRFIVDNCAMAGRSSKTFREEGRLKDIENHIQEGDYLLIQFGHNDAGAGKPERYVPLEGFRDSLAHYVNVALSHGATPILLSSIVLCPGKESETGEAGEISRLLPDYGKIMEAYAKDLTEQREVEIPYIDMNRLTGEWLKEQYINPRGGGATAAESSMQESPQDLYLPDHVHLVEKGALEYAQLAVDKLRRIIKD